jgi:hypothetical protein
MVGVKLVICVFCPSFWRLDLMWEFKLVKINKVANLGKRQLMGTPKHVSVGSKNMAQQKMSLNTKIGHII